MKKSRITTYAIIGAAILAGWYFLKRGMGGITFSRNPAKQGEFFYATATGLKPSVPITFGWLGITSTAGTSSVTGTFTWPDVVLNTTPVGNYTIFAQETSTGKRVTGILKVVAA